MHCLAKHQSKANIRTVWIRTAIPFPIHRAACRIKSMVSPKTIVGDDDNNFELCAPLSPLCLTQCNAMLGRYQIKRKIRSALHRKRNEGENQTAYAPDSLNNKFIIEFLHIAYLPISSILLLFFSLNFIYLFTIYNKYVYKIYICGEWICSQV